MTDSSNNDSRLRQVMDIHTPTWMSMPGVVAVGMGEGCINVYFADEQSRYSTSIPEKIEDWQVVKIVSQRFEAQ